MTEGERLALALLFLPKWRREKEIKHSRRVRDPHNAKKCQTISFYGFTPGILALSLFFLRYIIVPTLSFFGIKMMGTLETSYAMKRLMIENEFTRREEELGN